MIIIFVLHMHNQRTNAAQGGRTPNAHSRTRTRTRTRTHSLVAKCVQEKGVVACMKRKHPTWTTADGGLSRGRHSRACPHRDVTWSDTRPLPSLRSRATARLYLHTHACTYSDRPQWGVVREISFTQRFLDSLRVLIPVGENKNLFVFKFAELHEPPSDCPSLTASGCMWAGFIFGASLEGSMNWIAQPSA